MRISALLSGFSPVAVRGGGNSLPPFAAVQGSSGQKGLPADVFEQGQAWKSLAAARPSGVTGAKSCGCKTCAACAAQAYTEQAGGLKKDFPAPAEASEPGGKESAAASGASGSEPGKAAAALNGQREAEEDRAEPAQGGSPDTGGQKGVDGEELTRAERLQVAKLEAIDTKVRAHELAHLVAAGSYATGGASFDYAKGPDGKRYAVAGEVGIDTGKESTPEATISKMQTVRAAALAPADPSSQDRKVAAKATMVIAEASQELQMARLEEAREKAEGPAIPQAGEKEDPRKEDSLSNEQQAAAGVSGAQPPVKVQQATAIMAKLLRPAARISIAV